MFVNTVRVSMHEITNDNYDSMTTCLVFSVQVLLQNQVGLCNWS